MAKLDAHKSTEPDTGAPAPVSQTSETGFVQELGAMHRAVYLPQTGVNGKTLVVSFDNLDTAGGDKDRQPWGHAFFDRQGWSALGLQAFGPTWYRDPEVFAFFEHLARDKFFDAFERVVFYGASMGGYAACAFSGLCPGATVVAINPQATLERDLAGWDQRFPQAWRLDFSGKYGFAPDMVHSAQKVWLFHDARNAQDAMHATLFRGPNIIPVGCGFMGHAMLNLWRDLGILKPIIAGCINDTAAPHNIRQLLRKRHMSKPYQKTMLRYLEANKKHALVVRLSRTVLRRRGAPHFRNAMKDAQRHLGKTA